MVKRTSPFLLILIGTALVIGCGSNTPAGPAGPGGSGEMVISITGQDGNQAYRPAVATIAVAQTVTWRNDDTETHRPILTGVIDTKQLAPGATSAPTTISTPGTYDYKCTIHPSETGQVVVTP
jgi:plastocyanin